MKESINLCETPSIVLLRNANPVAGILWNFTAPRKSFHLNERKELVLDKTVVDYPPLFSLHPTFATFCNVVKSLCFFYNFCP